MCRRRIGWHPQDGRGSRRSRYRNSSASSARSEPAAPTRLTRSGGLHPPAPAAVHRRSLRVRRADPRMLVLQPGPDQVGAPRRRGCAHHRRPTPTPVRPRPSPDRNLTSRQRWSGRRTGMRHRSIGSKSRPLGHRRKRPPHRRGRPATNPPPIESTGSGHRLRRARGWPSPGHSAPWSPGDWRDQPPAAPTPR